MGAANFFSHKDMEWLAHDTKAKDLSVFAVVAMAALLQEAPRGSQVCPVDDYCCELIGIH